MADNPGRYSFDGIDRVLHDIEVLDPVHVEALKAAPRIIDGRNVLDPSTWKSAGFDYHGLGRR